MKRQKSLLFMLDKTVSKCIEAHIFGRPQKKHGTLKVPKGSIAIIIL